MLFQCVHYLHKQNLKPLHHENDTCSDTTDTKTTGSVQCSYLQPLVHPITVHIHLYLNIGP